MPTPLNYEMTNGSLTVVLYGVTSDSFSNEKVTEVLTLINRGRQVQFGALVGHEGTLSVQLYDRLEGTARAQRLAIEAIRNAELPITMSNPFGDVWTIAITAISFQRTAGVGLHEAGVVSISYTEIIVV